MESVNNSVSNLMLQKTLTGGVDKTAYGNKSMHGKQALPFDNAGACILNNMSTSNFDITMDNLVTFSDMLGTAKLSLDKMREQGESLLALINKAHDETPSSEELNSMNAEASKLIAEINQIFNGTEFNGINPLKTPVGINIPDWQNMVKQLSGLDESEQIEKTEPTEQNTENNQITNLLADITYNFDMSASTDSSSMNMQGSANIKIGFTDDGALQISVDASLDFDLSGIEKYGVQSDNALEILTQFLNLLTGKQNDLGSASNLLDSLMGNTEVNVDNAQSDSSQLKGKILQQATITLDGINQMPNIAINML